MKTKIISSMLVTDQDMIRVKVSYPDGKNGYYTTIEQVKERFKDETKEWLDNFIDAIVTNGVGYTNFGGKYEKL